MSGVFKKLFFAFFLLAVFLPVPAKAEGDEKTLLVFGDSLVSGYGLKEDEALPQQLEARLKKEGLPVKVYNGGVAGDTTTSALNRIDFALRLNPDYVIIVLGGNDMLRGIDPVVTRENMRRIMEVMKKHNIPVLLCGMGAFGVATGPTNVAYANMFKTLSKQYNTVLYPFILQDVAMKPELNQEDGIHPSAAGVKVIINDLLPSVSELLVRDGKSTYDTEELAPTVASPAPDKKK